MLTPHGRTLLQRARPLLRDLNTVERLASGLRQGWEPDLKLVVDVAFPRERLLAIIAELKRLCPETQLHLADAVMSGAEDVITEGRADLVVSVRVPSNHLGQFLGDVPFVAVAHPSHPLLALGRALSGSDLSRYVQSVVRDSGLKQTRDEGWLGAEQRYTVSSVEASLALVEAGLAYAWLPEHLVAGQVRSGALRTLPLATGGTRYVALYLVLVCPELAGPAARAAVECFLRHALGRSGSADT